MAATSSFGSFKEVTRNDLSQGRKQKPGKSHTGTTGSVNEGQDSSGFQETGNLDAAATQSNSTGTNWVSIAQAFVTPAEGGDDDDGEWRRRHTGAVRVRRGSSLYDFGRLFEHPFQFAVVGHGHPVREERWWGRPAGSSDTGDNT